MNMNNLHKKIQVMDNISHHLQLNTMQAILPIKHKIWRRPFHMKTGLTFYSSITVHHLYFLVPKPIINKINTLGTISPLIFNDSLYTLHNILLINLTQQKRKNRLKRRCPTWLVPHCRFIYLRIRKIWFFHQ